MSMSNITFRTQATHLHAVLRLVGIVTPSSVTPQGGAGYLFVIKDGKCEVHSRDQFHTSRAALEVEDVRGEGSFIYPANQVGALQCLDGWIEFSSNPEECSVSYETEGGASSKKTSFEARFMSPCDLSDAEGEREYPIAVLREALTLAKPYLAKSSAARDENEHFQTFQIFDSSKEEWAKGNGFLFAATGVCAFYFYCEAFKDKGLGLGVQHLPQILSFLSHSSGMVKVLTAPNMVYFVNSEGAILGCAKHEREHGKFSYYPLKADKYILRAPRTFLVKALKYARAELDPKLDKIRVIYTSSESSLRFVASDGGTNVANSVPVGVVPVGVDPVEGEDGFAINANVNHLLDLVNPVKAHEIELRVAILAPKGKKKVATFRTIDEFWLDDNGQVLIGQDDENKAHLCQVTRFMPSRD